MTDGCRQIYVSSYNGAIHVCWQAFPEPACLLSSCLADLSCEEFPVSTIVSQPSSKSFLAILFKMFIPFLFSWTLLLSAVYAVESRTITSTITSTITATASGTSSTPTELSTSLTSDTEFRSSMLNSTNFYRAQHNATDLTWNETLATYATSYAEKCLWKHSVRWLPHSCPVFTH